MSDRPASSALPAPSAGLVAIGAAVLDARGDQADAVLVLPAGSDVADRLAARVGAARIFAHPPAPPVWQPDRVPVCLADRDRDCTIQRPALWPGANIPASYRLRRLDTLYGGRGIGVLILADPPSAASVLHGAGLVLASARPAVLVDLRAIPADAGERTRDAVIALLSGYAWAPGLGATPCALPVGATLPLADLVRASTREIATPFDHALISAGLHPPEHDAPKFGRWTGAGNRTWFMLPRPAAGTWMLRLEIADWGNAAGGFAALLDGATLPPSALASTHVDFGPFRLEQAAGAVLRVDIFPPRPARDMRRGPRRIGLRIRRAMLRQVG